MKGPTYKISSAATLPSSFMMGEDGDTPNLEDKGTGLPIPPLEAILIYILNDRESSVLPL
jgi:hypothetical protein